MHENPTYPDPQALAQRVENMRHWRAVFPKVTNKRKLRFLAAYCAAPSVLRAAQAAGVSRASVYRWLGQMRDQPTARDPDFIEAVERAEELSAYWLHDVALRRIEEGSERILELYLKRADPRFRERHEHTVKGEVHQKVIVVPHLPEMEPADGTEAGPDRGVRLPAREPRRIGNGKASDHHE